jgi:Na+-transporting NADH:ubiquinone oxidoreductase subunit B
MIRGFLDKQHKHFVKGGKLEKLYPLYEAIDTFLYTPGEVNEGSVHVRDGIDLKRTMVSVVIALTPAILMALYNTGYQALSGYQAIGSEAIGGGWRGELLTALGFGVDPGNILLCFLLGALYFVPVFLVTNIVGGICEATFSIIRKHEINEGFLVTGMLFPLTLPATIPLWQVAVGIAFGVVVAKEVFGGTGKNFLNIALTARAFLYFAYPVQISGDQVWVAADGYTGATILGQAAQGGVAAVTHDFWDAFLGFVPGSMGETSVAAAIFGAGYLLITGIASWRIMLSVVLGAFGFAAFLNFVGDPTSNPMYSMTPMWHMVSGGLAFGLVFMATDPVSASMTLKGKWFYGALIGVMTIIIRTLNPAYPEGIMLAILFANVFAPTIDYFVVEANVKRRKLRYAKG